MYVMILPFCPAKMMW